MPGTTETGNVQALKQEMEYLNLVKQKLDIVIDQEETSSRWMHLNSARYYLQKVTEELNQAQNGSDSKKDN